jgi:hypothetical protein
VIARAWFRDGNRVARNPRPMHEKGKKRAKHIFGVLSAKHAFQEPLIFKEKLVGARGFEPPTSWSRTRKTLKMNDLAVGVGIATGCDRFFPCNDLRRERTNRSQPGYAQGGHSIGHSRNRRLKASACGCDTGFGSIS